MKKITIKTAILLCLISIAITTVYYYFTNSLEWKNITGFYLYYIIVYTIIALLGVMEREREKAQQTLSQLRKEHEDRLRLSREKEQDTTHVITKILSELKAVITKANLNHNGKPVINTFEIQYWINQTHENFRKYYSDGYHTFHELYMFRMIYNAALFNEWAFTGKYNVHKSWRHHDGELCFGGGWFIVVAVLPVGQISNHYKADCWDLFTIPEVEKALFPFDGHTSKDVIDRLTYFCEGTK